MDPLAQASLVGIGTTLVGALGAIGVAIVNGRTERVGSAENAREAVLRERIVLRDEQITDLKNDLATKDEMIDELRRELGRQERVTDGQG